MRSPRTCSANFHGPVATGLALGALLAAPRSCCLDWMKATEENSPWFTLLPNTTDGLSKRTVRVCGSSTSMLLISRNSGASELAEPSLASVAKV